MEESDKNSEPNSNLPQINLALVEQLSNEDFVLKTQQQISKDFAKFNLFFEDSFDLIPEKSAFAVEQKIEFKLDELLQHDPNRLMQLLYTIDLAEKEFRNLLSTENFKGELAKKILFREAYKVYLRSIF